MPFFYFVTMRDPETGVEGAGCVSASGEVFIGTPVGQVPPYVMLAIADAEMMVEDNGRIFVRADYMIEHEVFGPERVETLKAVKARLLAEWESMKQKEMIK